MLLTLNGQPAFRLNARFRDLAGAELVRLGLFAREGDLAGALQLAHCDGCRLSRAVGLLTR